MSDKTSRPNVKSAVILLMIMMTMMMIIPEDNQDLTMMIMTNTVFTIIHISNDHSHVNTKQLLWQ